MDLDGDLIGREARTLVEGKRCRMIESACMHPEARDRLCPGETDGFIHQEAAGPLADRFRHDAEKGQFALIPAAEIELEEACGLVLVEEPIDLDPGIAEYPQKLVIGHDEARIP